MADEATLCGVNTSRLSTSINSLTYLIKRSHSACSDIFSLKGTATFDRSFSSNYPAKVSAHDSIEAKERGGEPPVQ